MSAATEVSSSAVRVAMLGSGSMGGAILAGLQNPESGVATPIEVTTRSAASAAALANARVHAVALDDNAEANRLAVADADIVVLGVKPWLIVELAGEIAGAVKPGAIIVSVAAGVTAERIEAQLPDTVSVVRVMPNTPSTIGLGVAGIAAGSRATDAEVTAVARLFETVGSVVIVDESKINDVAAVSGSGPAYLFYFTEMLEAAARRRGFGDADARTLAYETVIGAAALLKHSGEDAAELRRRVTSPKGTTERAIEVFQAAGWDDVFDRALAANAARSVELEQG
ncbi:pyrroline-5-carboxylate reductase [Leucobacter sp. 1207-22]|uniref:pyrroline-5-carboxylate reductase n=1 Tax=Leucobacter sp. 1207-22 TaxID=2604456 RepID=UPI004063A9C2